MAKRRNISSPYAEALASSSAAVEGNASKNTNSRSQPKRVRFDARNPSTLVADADFGNENDEDEDDEEEVNVELATDEVGRGRNAKRNTVKLQGYDSDSENEGFDARAQALAREKLKEERELAKGNRKEDVDIFAESDEDEDPDDVGDDELTTKKQPIRFLNKNEIEGQEDMSKGGRHVQFDTARPAGFGGEKGKGKERETRKTLDDTDQESDTESEVDEEIRDALEPGLDKEIGAGGKRTHAPLLDAFNMRGELDEGQFDEAGNYVRKATDPDAIHDSWLEGMSKREIRKARAAEDKREEERRRQVLENNRQSVPDLMKVLIVNLQDGETPLKGLVRLGQAKEKKKPRWQDRRKKKQQQQDGQAGEEDEDDNMKDATVSEEEIKRKQTIDAITDAASGLLDRNYLEIYDTKREILKRLWKRETGETWREEEGSTNTLAASSTPPPAETANPVDGKPVMWEYKWTDTQNGDQIHGPYDGATMQQWNQAGYFGGGVEFRRAGEGGEWRRDVTFV